MGKITDINREARRKIAEECEMRGLDRCELRFKGCMGASFLAPAHKRRRINYHSAGELSDYNEWVAACVSCHTILDDRSLTTQEESDEIFLRLRGHEK